jgi:hypothetical protein
MSNPRHARLLCVAHDPAHNQGYDPLPKTFGHPYRRWFQIFFLSRRSKCKATSIDPVFKLVGSTRRCLLIYRARVFTDSVAKLAEKISVSPTLLVVTSSNIVALWYPIYGIYQCPQASSPGCHLQEVILAKLYTPTCQSSLCSPLYIWLKSYNAKIHKSYDYTLQYYGIIY